MGVNTSVTLDIVIAVVVLALVLYRQVIARPAYLLRPFVLPAILIVIGIGTISNVAHGHLSSTAVTYVTVDLVSSLALGAFRGLFVKLYEHDGVLWRQGGAVTMSLWGVAIGVRVLILVLASNAGVGQVSDAALDISFGLSLVGQSAVVALRGSRMGIPFAVAPARGLQ